MVDVMIPCFRPDEKLEELLRRLDRQTERPGRVILINTGRELLAKGQAEAWQRDYPYVSVRHITQEEFDHGGTRNLGASLSDAAYLLFMTQDAVPADRHLIENLLAVMKNRNIAAVYARQLPGRKSGEIEAFTRKFNYPEQSAVKTKEDLPRLGVKTYFCSDVCALYRRSAFDAMGGFKAHLICNEDMLMAARLIQAGWAVGYAADARVIHAHRYTLRQQYSRNFDVGAFMKMHEAELAVSTPTGEGIRLVRETALHLLKKGEFWLLPELCAVSAAKYLGFRAGSRYQEMPPERRVRHGMNRGFWKQFGTDAAGQTKEDEGAETHGTQ